MKHFVLLAFVILMATLMAACDTAAVSDGDPNIGIRFVLATDTEGCPISQTETDKNIIPSDISKMNFILYSRDEKKLVETQVQVLTMCDDPYTCVLQNAKDFKLFNVPTQKGMHLEIQAFNAANTLSWIGHNYGIDVTLQTDPDTQAVDIDIYMRRVGKMTLGFDCMQPTRMFHTATVLHDGTSILVVGGGAVIHNESCNASEFGNTVGCDLIVATKEVALFDTETGSFKEMKALGEKRAGHETVLLADGRVLIMGGAEQLWVIYNKDGRAYIEAEGTLIKDKAVLYNPNDNGFIDAYINMDIRRINFSVTPIDQDPPNATRFLIAGGWGTDGLLSSMQMLSFDPSGAGDTMPSFRQLDESLKSPRTAHTATRINNVGAVLFYGGTAPGNAVAEVFTSETKPTQLLNSFPNFNMWPNLYHHAALAFDNESKVLITGGMIKTASGSKEALGGASASSILIDFGKTTSSYPGMATSRAFHTMALLPDDRIAVIGGANGTGTNFDVGVTALEVFDGTTATFASFTDPAGIDLSLGLGRMGHTSTKAKDNSITIIGGAVPNPTPLNMRQKMILGSTEVYYPNVELAAPTE